MAGLILALLLQEVPATGGIVVVGPATGRHDEGLPLVCGLFSREEPLPRDPAGFWLVDEQGVLVPAVVHPEGGRLLLHGVLPAGSSGGDLRLRSGGSPLSIRALAVRGDATSMVIDNGRLVLDVGPQATIGLGGWRVVLLPRCGGGRWTVAHRCPLRADVVFEGRSDPELGGPSLLVRFLVTVHAGLERVDVGLHLTATTGGRLPRGSGLLIDGQREVWLRLGEGMVTGSAAAPRQVTWVDGAWWSGETACVPGARGEIVFEDRPPLAIALPAGRGEGLETVVLDGDPGGGRVLWAEPGTALARGEDRLYRATLACRETPPSGWPPVVPRPARAGLVAARLPRSSDSGDPLRRRVASELEEFLGGGSRGLIVEGPGAGDWRMDRETVGNLEYDGVLGLLQWTRASGDVRAFDQALASADHLLGHDRDSGQSGLFFAHGPAHRSGPVEAGHHWIGGLVLLDAWTGDPLRAGILERVLGDQLRSLGALDLGLQYPRSLGWGLLALADGAARSADPAAYAREIRRWRGHVLGTATRCGVLALVALDRGAGLGQENPFVQGGIIAPAVAASLLVVPSSRDRAVLRRLTRALAEEAVRHTEEGWTLADRLVLDRREGCVVGRAGAASGEEIAMFLAGLATADPHLRSDPALRGLRATIGDRLRLAEKTFVGGELTLLLRALPSLDGW